MSTTDEVREAEQRNAASLFLTFLASNAASLEGLEVDPTKAALGLETQSLADAIAVLQDMRARLTMVERDLVTTMGQREGRGTGSLSDGRQFTVERSSDRTAWDHDDWKRDVRRKIIDGLALSTETLVVVDASSGDEWVDVPLRTLLADAIGQAQDVHGATAPKSTALKRLGLYAGDYCTSSPSGWRFSAVKPTPTTEDTTKEPTDA